MHEQNTFTDPRDGEHYKTIRLMDGKEWFAENLRFASDDSVLGAPEMSTRRELLPFYEEYDQLRYGRLYTWDASQRVCPSGWHIPSAEEWRLMLDCYGGYVMANDSGADPKRATPPQLQHAGFAVMPGPLDGGLHFDHFASLRQACFWTSSEVGFWDKMSLPKGIKYGFYMQFGYCVVDQVDRCDFHLSVRCVR